MQDEEEFQQIFGDDDDPPGKGGPLKKKNSSKSSAMMMILPAKVVVGQGQKCTLKYRGVITRKKKHNTCSLGLSAQL